MPETLVDCTVKELVKVLRGFEIVVWNLQIVNTSKLKVLKNKPVLELSYFEIKNKKDSECRVNIL